MRLALDAGLLADVFFVLYGDLFLPIEFAPVLAAYQNSRRSALMTVMQNCDLMGPQQLTIHRAHCYAVR